MPTQKELLEEQKVSELRALADEHQVDISGLTKKEEIIDKLAASNKVTKAELEEKYGDDAQGGTVSSPEQTSPRVQAMTSLRSSRGPAASVDPAMGDTRDLVEARAQGRTSDPANRQEGVVAADVPPDLNEGPKPSDGGPEAYPFPPQGDVDVALVEPGSGKGEEAPLLNADDWVILDGTHELVPDRLDGHMAAVVSAPTVLCNCDWSPGTHEHLDDKAGITVKTRDEADATLVLPLDAFKQIGRGGRSAVLPVG